MCQYQILLPPLCGSVDAPCGEQCCQPACDGMQCGMLDGRTGGETTAGGIFRTQLSSPTPPRYAIGRWDLKAGRWRRIARGNARSYEFRLARRAPFTLIGIETTSTRVLPYLLQVQHGVLDELRPWRPESPVPLNGKLETDAVWSGDRAVLLAVIYRAAEFGNGKTFAEPHAWELVGQDWRELGPWDP